MSHSPVRRLGIPLAFSSLLCLPAARGDATNRSLPPPGLSAPLGDLWRPTRLGAPQGRRTHTAVWTGTTMIVWGGGDGYAPAVNSGGIYDPAADAWKETSTAGAPCARYWHTAVWTGTRMIVWGGEHYSPTVRELVNTGAIYDPATDSWTPTSTIGAPSPRVGHTAVWTGTKMIVWGGGGYDGDAVDTGGSTIPRRTPGRQRAGPALLRRGGSTRPSRRGRR